MSSQGEIQNRAFDLVDISSSILAGCVVLIRGLDKQAASLEAAAVAPPLAISQVTLVLKQGETLLDAFEGGLGRGSTYECVVPEQAGRLSSTSNSITGAGRRLTDAWIWDGCANDSRRAVYLARVRSTCLLLISQWPNVADGELGHPVNWAT